MPADYRVTKFLSLLRDEGAWVPPLPDIHFRCFKPLPSFWNLFFSLHLHPLLCFLYRPVSLFSLDYYIYIVISVNRMHFDHGSVMSHIRTDTNEERTSCIYTLKYKHGRKGLTINHLLTLTASFLQSPGWTKAIKSEFKAVGRSRCALVRPPAKQWD